MHVEDAAQPMCPHQVSSYIHVTSGTHTHVVNMDIYWRVNKALYCGAKLRIGDICLYTAGLHIEGEGGPGISPPPPPPPQEI